MACANDLEQQLPYHLQSAEPAAAQPCGLLDLPRELRDKIYDLHFFHDKDKTWNKNYHLLIYGTERNNDSPVYRIQRTPDHPLLFHFITLPHSFSIPLKTQNVTEPAKHGEQTFKQDPASYSTVDCNTLGTNHQIHAEAEQCLYNKLIFDFQKRKFGSHLPAYKFFDRLPPRCRRYIRLVRCDWFYPGEDLWGEGFQWQSDCQFFAQECTSLQTLQITLAFEVLENAAAMNPAEAPELRNALQMITGLQKFDLTATLQSTIGELMSLPWSQPCP